MREYQESLLLRLLPGDPGYNTWELARREFQEEVGRLLTAVQDFSETMDGAISADAADENVMTLVDLWANCPMEVSVL